MNSRDSNSIWEIKRDFSEMIQDQLRGELLKTMDVLEIPKDISFDDAIDLVKSAVEFRFSLRKRLLKLKEERT